MQRFEMLPSIPPALQARGMVWKFGDYVDTEEMCFTRYFPSPPSELRQHVFEHLRPDFGRDVKPGDLIVGGRAFGCGHGHDHANVAVKSTGIAGIIATSFGSQFQRHAVDHAMPLIRCSEAVAGIEDGQEVEADFETGEVRNLTTGAAWLGVPLRGLQMDIVRIGGLVPYVKRLTAQARS